MQAVENDEEYELYNPRTKIHEGSLLARDVFNLIVTKLTLILISCPGSDTYDTPGRLN